MSGWRAPSRKVLVGLLLVAAVGSVAAVAAGEYLVAPIQPAPLDPVDGAGVPGDSPTGEHRCGWRHANPFGWFG